MWPGDAGVRTLAVALVLALLVVATGARAGGGRERSPDAAQGTSPISAASPAEPVGGPMGARRGGQPGAYAAALAAADALPSAPLTAAHSWADVGPTNLGGRLTDVALPPDGSIVVAAASGGVWRSVDGGRTLQPAWPDDLTPAIGAVAATADGVLLAGTGEANAGGGSVTYGGTGVYRSVDMGATWTSVGLSESGVVARILADPEDPDRLFLAAGGDLFGPGGQRGIYRSTDAGLTWTQVLAPVTPTAGGADLAIDPSDPDHVLAAMWDRQRTPAERRYGGEGSGLFRTTDGGETWTAVDTLPGFTPDAGRIAVAFSPADPQRVYAVVTRGDGRAGGLWRSDDGGVGWTRVDDDPVYEPTQFIFAWWFSKVFPAPDDPDRVLVPGLDLLESTDGGVTFTGDGRIHPDQHAMVWDPLDSSVAWAATDGGLYRSDAGGASLSWQAAEAQGFTQLYDVATLGPGTILGGFQDRGCNLTAGGADAWRPTGSCGDGTTVLADPADPTVGIICGQYGMCRRTVGASLTRPDTARSAWDAPLIALPAPSPTLLYGGVEVHRSDDGGRTWQAISGDLTRGRSPDLDYPFGTIWSLAAADDGTSLAAGTDDGLVWRTDDAGATWRTVADGADPVTGLAFMPGPTPDLVVTRSGYLAGGSAPTVALIDAGGATTDLSTGLPLAPLNDVLVIDGAQGRGADGSAVEEGAGAEEGTDAPARPADLVVASDVGVFVAQAVTADDLSTGAPAWRRVGDDLPQAPVTSLDHGPDGLLTIGTYGRGVRQIPLPTVSRVAGPDRFTTAATIARPDAAHVVVASGEDFPDALAAAAVVAAEPGATLLLTAGPALPAATEDAIVGIGPDRLTVVGGESVVSPAVAARLEVLTGLTPARIAGASRYATAARLATAGLAAQSDPGAGGSGGADEGGADESGTDESGAGDGAPVDGGAEDPPASDPPPEDGPVIDIGTPSTVERSTVVLATAGQPFDALAGAAYAASLEAPILLVDPDRLPPETAEALAALAPTDLVALGGAAAISDAVLAEAASAARPPDGSSEPATSVRTTRLAGDDRLATAAAISAAITEPVLADVVWLASATSFPDALAAAATGGPVLLTERDALSAQTLQAVVARRPTDVRIAGGTASVGEDVLTALRLGPTS